MKLRTIPTDYAVVLQQIYETGREDFSSLAESLRFDRKRLAHILQALQHKGLIQSKTMYTETWISVSGKGQRLIKGLWPEAMAAAA